jgi:hypothetical protein
MSLKHRKDKANNLMDCYLDAYLVGLRVELMALNLDIYSVFLRVWQMVLYWAGERGMNSVVLNRGKTDW